MTQGERLEALLPRLMRVVLPSSDADPMGHLPVAQIRLIRVIGETDRAASDVAEELGVSLSALSQMVSRLEEAGLVHKYDLPDDRRCRMLGLTESAHRLAEYRRLMRSHCADSALAKLSPEEQETLLHLLCKLVGPARLGPSVAVAETADRNPF